MRRRKTREIGGNSVTDPASEPRVWFITGCSTGFGRELAKAVLARGERVVATARNVEQVQDFEESGPELARAFPLDVTDLGQVSEAVDHALDAFGRIDVLVNNAGYGSMGAVEEVHEEEIRRQFEVNVFGVLNVTRAVLPHMREMQSGHVINISSVGGFVGVPGFGIYNGTKFAVEGISEALAQEVEPLGIRVTIVEPGAFRTDWAGRSLASAPEIDDYKETVGQTRGYIANENGNQQGNPKLAAEAMISAVEADVPPLRLPLGDDALGMIRDKLDSVKREIDAWEPTIVETSFEHSAMK
jgi:NAD(P)-dependent dehydrogenase (short-subunit alcohol dehydrogenase family)